MRFTRTSPPASAEHLRNEAAQRRANLAAMNTERAELVASVADLVGDPAHDKVEARLAELDIRIPVEERILARIEAAIPAAEKREEAAKLRADIAEQERQTAKRCRTLEARYTAAAKAFADVLQEMQDDDRAWARLRNRAHDLGLQGIGQSAEDRLRAQFRTDMAARLLGTVSLPSHALVNGWRGEVLFRGPRHDYAVR